VLQIKVFGFYSNGTILTFMHYACPFDREKINEQRGIKKAVLIGKVLLVTVASLAIGFVMGVDWLENAIRKELAKRRRFS
jgi:hypothetical protein